MPEGIFQVVHGDKEMVDAILDHPEIKAVSFVGSTPIAHYIYERGAHFGKRVQALGGAKNHMLVLPDADLDMAADAAISAGYGAAGERCMAISVVLATDTIADELVAAGREPPLRALRARANFAQTEAALRAAEAADLTARRLLAGLFGVAGEVGAVTGPLAPVTLGAIEPRATLEVRLAEAERLVIPPTAPTPQGGIFAPALARTRQSGRDRRLALSL